MHLTGVAGVGGQLDGLHLCPRAKGERCQDRAHLLRVASPPQSEGAILTWKPPEPEEPALACELLRSIRLERLDLVDEVARRTRWERDLEGGEELRPLMPWCAICRRGTRIIWMGRERNDFVGTPHAERHGKQDRFECRPVVGSEQADGAPFPWCQRRPPESEEVPLHGELL